MRNRQLRMAQVALGAVFASATVLGSYGVAGAVYSYHGDDYSYDYNSKTRLRVCDREADSNPVHGGYDLDLSGGESGQVADNDGANAVPAGCGTGGPNSGTIKRHHTCEKNHLTWNCDNWKAT